jgi:hypothetical protein
MPGHFLYKEELGHIVVGLVGVGSNMVYDIALLRDDGPEADVGMVAGHAGGRRGEG